MAKFFYCEFPRQKCFSDLSSLFSSCLSCQSFFLCLFAFHCRFILFLLLTIRGSWFRCYKQTRILLIIIIIMQARRHARDNTHEHDAVCGVLYRYALNECQRPLWNTTCTQYGSRRKNRVGLSENLDVSVPFG